MMSAPESTASVAATAPVLPAVGLSTWRQIAPFLPFGRETWRKLVRAEKAPQPIRLSGTCAAYRNEEIHRYLADPTGYRAARTA
jgi:predicted DNA-binding transcriptional regulator AlpA